MVSNKISIVITITLACIYLAETKPWEPEPRPEQSWMDRHNQFVEYSRTNGSNINIVFMGSSSIERWSTTGGSIWRSKYAPLGAVNYGIGADKIEHCLWRIQNGELQNMNPRLIVLYCGSNNVPSNPSSEEITRGITAAIDDLKVRLPNTKILYVQFNPRGDVSNIEDIWGRITVVNSQVARLHDGNKVNIFDMFDDYISSWGQIKTELYAGDKLHMNEAGYAVWDGLWNQTLTNLLG